MNGAVVAIEFIFSEVGLARYAIQTAVLVEFDIAGIEAGLQQLLHAHAMARLGGANEVIVRNVEPLPCLLEEGCDGIGECLW